MTTSVIQQKRLPKNYFVNIKGVFLYHRSGEKPLDPTTLKMVVQNKSGWSMLKPGVPSVSAEGREPHMSFFKASGYVQEALLESRVHLSGERPWQTSQVPC